MAQRADAVRRYIEEVGLPFEILIDGHAVPAFKGSSDITSMAHADGYIEIPAQTDLVEAGEMVQVKLF